MAQDAPRVLVTASAEVQVGSEHHGVILYRGGQVTGLKLTAGRAEPLMPWRSSGIEVGTHHPECSTTKVDGRGDRNSPLEHEGQLDSVSIRQRMGRENRVAPITLQRAVPHGGGVSQVHAQGVGRLNYILLRPKLGPQHSPCRS
jgi:hypothetical protein